MVLRSRTGLTFIEVMVTVAVLSVGLVGIYRSFLIGADTYAHLANRLYAQNLIESRIATIERKLRSPKDFDVGPLQEQATINNRKVVFSYQIDLRPVSSMLSIFQLDIKVSWQERDRTRKLSRSAYFSGVSSSTTGGVL